MHNNNLPCASPESLGIPSRAIIEFLDELKRYRLPIHSVLFMRHGTLAAEGYCPPFDANANHRMYSVSKSFTAVAIGKLLGEGKVRLDEKISDIFPEYVTENTCKYILEATVRDMLTMSTFTETHAYDRHSRDFIEAFFNNSFTKHKSGVIFQYNTAATVTLCGIIEKRSGQSFMDFMRPIFDEIGMSKGMACIETPEGRAWTGSGMLCTPRDLMRFGLLCLNRGAWNGKQLIDREYMLAATSYQMDNTVSYGGLGAPMGYGYQFWMLEEGGFGCFGMGSQYAYMMPKYDTVMVITADTQAIGLAGDAIRFAHYRLLDKLVDGALPEDSKALGELQNRLNSLALPLPAGKKTTPRAREFSGVKYVFEHNKYDFKWMRADIKDDVCTLVYENRTGEHTLNIYMGAYGELIFPEKYYGARIGVADREYRALSAGAWTRDDSLLAIVYAVDDYLGAIKMQLAFAGDTLTVFMTNSAEWFFDGYSGYLSGRANNADCHNP